MQLELAKAHHKNPPEEKVVERSSQIFGVLL